MFHLLPHDILYKIFVLSAAAAAGELTDPYVATVLSHVCSTWRATALATPPIWTRIVLPARSNNAKNREAKLYLERSANLRATMVIRVHPVAGPMACPSALPELLAQNRIYYLILQTSTLRDAGAFMGFINRLSARMGSVTKFNLTVANIKVFEFTRMKNAPFRAPTWSIEESRFLWHRWYTAGLITLVLSCIVHDIASLESVRTVLVGCQSTLKHLVFSGRAPPPLSASPPPVTLPALQFLHIAYYNEVSGLVKLIHAPRLLALELSDMSAQRLPRVPSTDEPALLAALRPSCHNVLHLSLTRLAGSPSADSGDYIETFFHQMPHVVHLHLVGTAPAYRDALFQPKARGAVVFPRLLKLAVTYTSPVGLLALLSRHTVVPGVFPLRSLRISSRQWAEAHATKSRLAVVLDRIAQDGVDLLLEHEGGSMVDLD